MRLTIAAVLSILAFTPLAFSQAQAQQLPVVITSEYYAGPKTLVVHVLNNSGRDIIAYTFVIRHKNSDGTPDEGGRSATTADGLSALITTQMAKDPAASESIRQQSVTIEALYAAGNGIFAPGTTRDMTMNRIDNGSEVNITAGVVFYADGSFVKQEEDPFKQMLTMRQGRLLAMKKANEVIKGALANPASEHPVTTAITELAKSTGEAIAHNADGPYDTERFQIGELQMVIQTLRDLQLPQTGTTERERLMQYVEEQGKRIELMTPHCHLEIALQDPPSR